MTPAVYAIRFKDVISKRDLHLVKIEKFVIITIIVRSKNLRFQKSNHYKKSFTDIEMCTNRFAVRKINKYITIRHTVGKHLHYLQNTNFSFVQQLVEA